MLDLFHMSVLEGSSHKMFGNETLSKEPSDVIGPTLCLSCSKWNNQISSLRVEPVQGFLPVQGLKLNLETTFIAPEVEPGSTDSVWTQPTPRP